MLLKNRNISSKIKMIKNNRLCSFKMILISEKVKTCLFLSFKFPFLRYHEIVYCTFVYLKEKKKSGNLEISVGNNTRKLTKICSSNLYPFSLESIVERILATTNESRLGDKVSIFSQHFQDCIY